VADVLDRLKTALQDRYTIDREIGAGGMAAVYLARDLRHDRDVAIKVLRPDLAAVLGPERFLQEIRIAAQLQHPNILPLLDSGEASGSLYYVMPYVEGQSLRDKLAKEGELPIAEAVRIVRDIVDALTEAHARGVVHRDIKPENILLRGRHALVTDFGVAKAVSEATGREKLTTAGVALGTPAYMAPEQASADPHLDQRVDIYAVGAVAYELLTGRPVFMGTTPQMILSAHMTDTPEPVTKHRDTVPAALESVVMRCLEKRPADRWQSAEELLPQLEALATPSGGVTPTDTQPIPATAVKRRWLMPGALAAAVILIVVGVLLSRVLAPSPITIRTSNIRAVTSEPGMEWQPALSPDGTQVAYVIRRTNRRSIVIRITLNIAGVGQLTPTQGLDESSLRLPSWSPDGEFVRFVSCIGGSGSCSFKEVAKYGGSVGSIDLPSGARSCGWSLDGVLVACAVGSDRIVSYSINDGTSSLVVVHPQVQWSIHSPVWSPDGKWIAYVDGNYSWGRGGFNVDVSSIWMVDANGGEPLRVTGEDCMNISPAWLDNQHLLFVSNRDGLREAYVVEVGATGLRSEPRKVPGVTDAHSISYSIAGRRLAFSKATVRQNIWSYGIGSGPLSNSDGEPLTNDNAIIESHDVSPDGEWIVFDSNLRGNQDIYTLHLGGGSPTPVTNSPMDDWIPRWSPDGTEIAFIRDAGAGDWRVMVLPADGGTPVQVASGLATWSPEWSPSGLEIAFQQGPPERRVTWIASREAIGGSWSEPSQVTDHQCQPTDWAPDGSGVLCHAGGEMILVSRDGEVLWRYDLSAVGLRFSTQSRFAWDGSTIYVGAVHEGGARGLWSVSPHGGEPKLVVAYADVDVIGGFRFSVGPERLYATVLEVESDVWVMDVEVVR
jgi:serine/threonine protein kinase